MKIKTKLILSVIVEVLMIFIMTEYIHHLLTEYKELQYKIERLEEKKQNALREKNIQIYTQIGLQESKIKQKANYLIEKASILVVIIPLFSLVIIGIGGYITYRNIVIPINKMIITMRKIQEGDLTRQLNLNKNDELGMLASEFDKFVSWIKSVFIELTKLTSNVSTYSVKTVLELIFTKNKNKHIEDSSLELSLSSELLTHSVNNVNIEVDNIYKNAKKMNEEAKKGNETVDESIQSVQELADDVIQSQKEMERFLEDSEKIKEVVETIKSIAEQTNLLALNASIEAARAGKYGKGFSVVAEEVGNLANKTAKEVQQVKNIVENLTKSIDNLAKNFDMQKQKAITVKKDINSSKEAFHKIKSMSEKLFESSQVINTLINEQLGVLDIVKNNVISIEEKIKDFGNIFSHLAQEIMTQRKAINSVEENLSKFKLGSNLFVFDLKFKIFQWIGQVLSEGRYFEPEELNQLINMCSISQKQDIEFLLENLKTSLRNLTTEKNQKQELFKKLIDDIKQITEFLDHIQKQRI